MKVQRRTDEQYSKESLGLPLLSWVSEQSQEWQQHAPLPTLRRRLAPGHIRTCVAAGSAVAGNVAADNVTAGVPGRGLTPGPGRIPSSSAPF
ncbi:MAG TPA: hypothetical protein VFJ06_09365 [Halococcus sp.]|nr:hypothetical protein [Halococcus sp.]